MKVIFLDIDGVLNSDRFLTEQHNVGFFEDVDQIDPSRIEILNRLIDQTKANIVISSAWRLFFNFNVLCKFLNNLGISGSIIGKTPDFKGNRDLEISKWIADNKPSSIVILEDVCDMNDLLPFTIMTNPNIGLTNDDVDRAIKILDKKCLDINRDDLKELVFTLTEDEKLICDHFNS